MSTDYFTSCCCYSLLQASCYRVTKVTEARSVTRINLPSTKRHTRKEVMRKPGQACHPHSLCISSTYKVVGVNSRAGGDPCFWLRHYAFKRNSTLQMKISASVFLLPAIPGKGNNLSIFLQLLWGLNRRNPTWISFKPE